MINIEPRLLQKLDPPRLGLGFGVGLASSERSNTPLAHFATRASQPDDLNPSFTQIFSRTIHTSRADVVSIQLEFANWYVKNGLENAPGSPATLHAAIEYPLGTTRTRIKFDGADSVTIPDGGSALSDMLKISIPNGGQFAIKTLYENSAGILFSTTVRDSSVERWESGTGMLTDNTTSTTNPSLLSTVGYSPVAIVSRVALQRSFFIIGDSRARGVGDAASTGLKGELERSIGSYPFINCARSSEVVPTASYARRVALSRYCTHILSNLGINDILSARTPEITASRLSAFAGQFRKPFYQLTIAPKASSTDGWVTTVNQTVDAENPDRVAYNNLIRGGLANVAAYIEVADVVETSRDSGIWRANYTGDGLHQSAAGYAAIATSGVVGDIVDP